MTSASVHPHLINGNVAAHRQRDSVSRLWLNPFFRDAERAGELSPSWYLTSIDFGAEINKTVRGAGFDVVHYSLTGVR